MGTRQRLNVLGTRCSEDATGHGLSLAVATPGTGPAGDLFEHPGCSL